MDITPVIPKDMLVISRYGGGGFVINDAAYQGNILILENDVLPWKGDSVTETTVAAFWVMQPPPEIVILGTGASCAGPSAELRSLFRAHHVPMDMMDTGAACRTYNVLLSEGRRVAAALIAV